jgi:hypothetical protein
MRDGDEGECKGVEWGGDKWAQKKECARTLAIPQMSSRASLPRRRPGCPGPIEQRVPSIRPLLRNTHRREVSLAFSAGWSVKRKAQKQSHAPRQLLCVPPLQAI